MNKTKKQTHRYGEQASGYQWGEGKEGTGNIGVGDLEVQTTMYKINKLQGYIYTHTHTHTHIYIYMYI